MALDAPPATGMDRREARRLLARMDRMEEFARKYEEIERHFPDLPRWELECQRQNFADTYRRLVGVSPEERHQLKRWLADLGRLDQ